MTGPKVNWRDIKAVEIDWVDNPISQRAGYKVRMMCSQIYIERRTSWTRYECGGWSDMTLGQIADMGERAWRRCSNIGDLGVCVIKWGIDEAAEGRCPMLPGNGAPAADAYVPKAERAEALAERDVRTWRPIETAPRDGTRVLVGWADGAPLEIAHWQEGSGAFSLSDAWEFSPQPTHWMPLPEPPK